MVDGGNLEERTEIQETQSLRESLVFLRIGFPLAHLAHTSSRIEVSLGL